MIPFKTTVAPQHQSMSKPVGDIKVAINGFITLHY
jgi:hypothetical protein